MHESVTENRGNLYGMKAFNKLINNAPEIQTENIYSLYNRLYCLSRILGEYMKMGRCKTVLKIYEACTGLKLHVLHWCICFS